jgi:PknH-like extracellular domain
MGSPRVVTGVQVVDADDPESTSGWRTSHAMRAANNVVIDVRVTDYAVSDRSVRVVNAITRPQSVVKVVKRLRLPSAPFTANTDTATGAGRAAAVEVCRPDNNCNGGLTLSGWRTISVSRPHGRLYRPVTRRKSG